MARIADRSLPCPTLCSQSLAQCRAAAADVPSLAPLVGACPSVSDMITNMQHASPLWQDGHSSRNCYPLFVTAFYGQNLCKIGRAVQVHPSIANPGCRVHCPSIQLHCDKEQQLREEHARANRRCEWHRWSADGSTRRPRWHGASASAKSMPTKGGTRDHTRL